MPGAGWLAQTLRPIALHPSGSVRPHQHGGRFPDMADNPVRSAFPDIAREGVRFRAIVIRPIRLSFRTAPHRFRLDAHGFS